ncbi:hypothetical protein [Zobellia galactanivorans]|uniref:Uncharacterized protein n=1 Tax=Zobellia galactanivorans (strain DSM 12802 / CCUG 47099 / CIP 106680 / NCIMB 13871 / Dsij) TaxID=63186 RepID=G0KZW5_ZOBGA|nr:hypothetical protein [Zobellia galactanivorans]CAZ97224.1 Hypothetical protein ZOBELLIA_3085 [Zobellia galactanivorans]
MKESEEQLAGSVPNRDKTVHNKGDLHYGLHSARYQGMSQISKETNNPFHDPQNPKNNDPLTIDNLNDNSLVIDKLTDGPDYMENYFELIEWLKTRKPRQGLNHAKNEEWLKFLKDNIKYLQLDKQIAQVKSGGEDIEPTKDRLHKNGLLKDKSSVEEIKRALIDSFDSKRGVSEKYQEHINRWVYDAFFRRTSKLGIDYTINNGNRIHFNTASEFDKKGKSIVSHAENPEKKQRQPITDSEIRHIHRKYGHDHPQMDLYSFDSFTEAGIERGPNIGHMKIYEDKRREQGKETPKRGLFHKR